MPSVWFAGPCVVDEFSRMTLEKNIGRPIGIRGECLTPQLPVIKTRCFLFVAVLMKAIRVATKIAELSDSRSFLRTREPIGSRRDFFTSDHKD